jgi:hypothetical protein
MSIPLPPQSDRGEQARSRRYEPTPVYVLAERLKRAGVKLHKAQGPWRAMRRFLRRTGRNAERTISVVTNGVAEIAVDTAEHAVDVSGFLNWCGLHNLNPIPSLRPPRQDLAYD